MGGGGAILHYDGSSWSLVASGTTSSLKAVWGSSANDVYAVGENGTILHYDGESWSEMNYSTSESLSDLWGSSSTDIFVVGSSGTIIHYDGNSWSEMISTENKYLNGIWGSSSTDVFAVGSAWNSETNTTAAFILHYDGFTWREKTSNISGFLDDVWGSSANDVYVVGENGTILHYDGSTWNPMDSGITSSLFSIWGSSSTDIFAVGDFGIILHYFIPKVPSVTTAVISSIASTTASSGGDVTDDGGAEITGRGVCWSTAINPTINDSITFDGTALGTFISSIKELNPGTTYHVRAYATNSVGTGYGDDASFNTSYTSTLYVTTDGNCEDKTPCYSSIQNAINDAADGSLILIAVGAYGGPFSLNQPMSLTLRGGWNSSLTSQTGTTILRNAPKAPQGSLTLQMLSIKPE